jgi:hypothetical protein
MRAAVERVREQDKSNYRQWLRSDENMPRTNF